MDRPSTTDHSQLIAHPYSITCRFDRLSVCIPCYSNMVNQLLNQGQLISTQLECPICNLSFLIFCATCMSFLSSMFCTDSTLYLPHSGFLAQNIKFTGNPMHIAESLKPDLTWAPLQGEGTKCLYNKIVNCQ